MDYQIGKAARLIKALALGFAATLAVFAVAGLHTKTDTEFAGILMLALAVGVLVALGVWI